MFISFHTNQKRHKGVVIQAFLHFLPTKEPCQPRRVSLTETGRNHNTPKRTNNNSHKTLALVQLIRIWSIDSSSTPQKKHLLAKCHSLLFSRSKVSTLPHEALEPKKTHFCGNTRAPNNALRERYCTSRFKGTIKGLNRKILVLSLFPRLPILHVSGYLLPLNCQKETSPPPPPPNH